MNDSYAAARSLTNLKDHILNVIPRTGGKSNKWVDKYTQLKEQALDYMQPKMQFS